MKKLFVLLALPLLLFGCGKNDGSSQTTETEPKEVALTLENYSHYLTFSFYVKTTTQIPAPSGTMTVFFYEGCFEQKITGNYSGTIVVEYSNNTTESITLTNNSKTTFTTSDYHEITCEVIEVDALYEAFN